MYTKSVHYDVASLIIEIESELEKNKFTIKIVFNEGCISFRATEEPYLERFWELYKDVNWKQTFFIIENSSRYNFFISGDKFIKHPSNPPELGVHYAIYTYDVFFEIFSLETPIITMYPSPHKEQL